MPSVQLPCERRHRHRDIPWPLPPNWKTSSPSLRGHRVATVAAGLAQRPSLTRPPLFLPHSQAKARTTKSRKVQTTDRKRLGSHPSKQTPLFTEKTRHHCRSLMFNRQRRAAGLHCFYIRLRGGQMGDILWYVLCLYRLKMILKRDHLFCAASTLLAEKEINTAKCLLQHKQGGTFIIGVIEQFGLVGFFVPLPTRFISGSYWSGPPGL